MEWPGAFPDASEVKPLLLDLHELYGPAGAPTHAYYDIATAQWASRWPVEDLWAATYDPSRPTS